MASFMSKFSACVIRGSGRKRTYSIDKKREKYIDNLVIKNRKPFILPPFPYRSEVKIEKHNGVELVTFNKGRDKKIIYLHGGAFCEPPLLPHFMLCDRVAAETDYEVILPVYKRAPEHTFDETFEFLDGFYKKLLGKTESENLVFMGDSSGGGLAISFCEYLKTVSLPQPKRMILLSPWIDVSMDTPFSEDIDRVDPNLQYDFLKVAGENWAGSADVHDYRVSPIYGDLTGLAPMTVYYGTHENFITDAHIFKDKCKKAGVPLDWHEVEGMNHVFVIYPIPEANTAQKEIIALLKSI